MWIKFKEADGGGACRDFGRVRTAAARPCPPTAGGMSSEVINARVLAARNFARPDRGPETDVFSGSQGSLQRRSSPLERVCLRVSSLVETIILTLSTYLILQPTIAVL